MKKYISVNMVNKRSKRAKDLEKLIGQKTATVAEIDFDTADQSIHVTERKTTESRPIHNVEEPATKTIEFSSIGNGDEITNNTSETIEDDSQTKRTSFTERLAAMVGMKPREKEEIATVTEKTKILVRFPR